MSKILQATLHTGIHTPKSGSLGAILVSESTNGKQALNLTLEKISGEIFLAVEGVSNAVKTRGLRYRILVPMYNVVNLDVEPTTTSETVKAV